MTTHLPPLQVGATAGATYVGGSFPEADQSYYGHNSYPAPTSSYASQSASNGTSSSSPPSYGTDEGPAFSIGAGSVTSDGQHHVRIFALVHPQVTNFIHLICFSISIL